MKVFPMNTRILLAAAAVAAMMAGAAHATTDVAFTVEAQGQTTTTAALASKGVETFSEVSPGQYPTLAATFAGAPGVTGTYAGLGQGVFQVNGQDQYSNDGNYGVTFDTAFGGAASHGYSLTLGGGVFNYFGLYVEAMDWSNQITFYNGATKVGEFDVASLQFNPGDPDQGKLFVNIFTGATFDKVVFLETDTVGATRGFESDNHTVGLSGAVPEPAAWSLMIVGFMGMGGALRSRRRMLAA
jgi:hypothetical protein